jgi:hypothetical protein
VAPFVRYLFLALVILIARSICCRSPRIEINVRESSIGGGGPVRLHRRVFHSILDLSDRRSVLIVANSDSPRCNILIFLIKFVPWSEQH